MLPVTGNIRQSTQPKCWKSSIVLDIQKLEEPLANEQINTCKMAVNTQSTLSQRYSQHLQSTLPKPWKTQQIPQFSRSKGKIEVFLAS